MRIIGIDYGDARVGISITDALRHYCSRIKDNRI